MEKSNLNNVSNIQVAVRVSPPLPREISDGQMYNCVAVGSLKNNCQQVFVSLNNQPVIISEEAV